MNKKLLSLFLALCMIVTVLPLNIVTAFANSSDTDAKIVVESQYTKAGTTVDVNLKAVNNPGIAGAKITVSYSSDLMLVGATNGEAFSVLDYTAPGSYEGTCNFNWDSLDAVSSSDGVFLTLKFMVATTATVNDRLNIEISYREGDIYDYDTNNVNFDIVNGFITVIDYMPGDVNDDGVINGKDVTLIRRYNAGIKDGTFNESAADVNDDGVINGKDVTLIRRYNAGGYGVKLLPVSPKCPHTMIATEAKDATCTDDGNTAYWYCSSCGKYFSDAKGAREITPDSTVIKGSHNLVHVNAKAATTNEEGNLEYWHCTKCDKYYTASSASNSSETTYDKLVLAKIKKEQSTVVYNVYGSDSYLESVGVNNPNPTSFAAEDGLVLNDLIAPKGYVFKGWQTASGTSIEKIEPGAARQIVLNAVWYIEPSSISFKSDLVPVSDETYTVNHEHVLPSPKMDGYIFAGWSDASGDIIKSIPLGTTGNKTYTANWISERNQAWGKNEIGAPVIYEDEQTNTILFAYDIGEIRNVPLSVIEDFGKINSDGVSKTVTKKVSKSVSQSEMETYTNTVQKATTDSFAWTLSNGWSEGTTVNESWCQEKGVTTEEANTYSRSDSSNWYVSSGSSGYDTTVTLNTKDKYNLKTTTDNKKTYNTKDNKKYQDFSAELNLSREKSVGAKGSVKVVDLEAGVKDTIGGGVKYGNGKETTTHTGTETEHGTEKQKGSIKHTGTEKTHNSSWNSESGSGGSSTVSQSQTVSRALSEKISQQYGYGKSYISTNEQSTSQGLTTSNSNSDQYSSAVTYSTVTGEETETTYSTSNTKSGYHRWIMAGTAHVFAVVGYDIKTSSYFTYTYTVMDDEMHEYEDYSVSDASYNDNENSIISFEVPTDIEDYVANRVCESEGLEVSKEGLVTAYTGTDTYVVIPEYKVLDNRDGTKSVIKITGISENAFRGNTSITGIEMSDFITEIPNNAFANCTSLEEFSASSITSIGDNAFSNCSKLEACAIDDNVTHLGNNVVNGLSTLIVHAANQSVVEAAVSSGAKDIFIFVSDKCDNLGNTVLTIPSTTESFTFNGFGRTYNDLTIVSDSKTTTINRANFNSTGTTPLQLSSETIELNEVNITAPCTAAKFTSNVTDVKLRGTVSLYSNSRNTLLCKNITLGKLDQNIYSELVVDGDVLIYGNILDGDSYLKPTGKIRYISEEEYNKYLSGVFMVTFNANEGVVTETSREAYYGIPLGELPVPTRDYYRFDGWYTDVTGGTKVESSYVSDSDTDITLYAHWSQNECSDWVLESEVPENATIENQKWTYDLTSYTTSSASSLAGWTKYNTTWVWSSWGSWSAWSSTPAYKSDSRDVKTTNLECYYHYYKSGGGNHTWCPTTHVGGTWHQVNVASGVMSHYAQSSDDGRNKYKGPSCPSCGRADQWFRTSNPSIDDCTGYSYRDRHKVYTYYYKKTEAKESATEVTASDSISNVKKWVQYREK